MEPVALGFATTTAENIYTTALKRAVTSDGREKVDFLFHAAALSNLDTELDEEEAQIIADALNKYDRGKLLWLGYVRYDDQEIDTTWEEVMSKPIFPEVWEYMQGFDDKFAQFFAWSIGGFLLHSSESTDLEEMPAYFQAIAAHPEADLDDVTFFYSEVMNVYMAHRPYDSQTGEITEHLDVPGFSWEGYMEIPYALSWEEARVLHDAFIYEADLKAEFETNSLDLAYLEQAVQSENQELRHAALLSLGEMQQGRDLIIDYLQTAEEGTESSPIAFTALSSFKDEETADFLLDYLKQCPFVRATFARSAIANYGAPEIVIKKLEERLDSPNLFMRGEAASLLKYFNGKEEFAAYKTGVRYKLTKMSRDENEDPIVRAIANETLDSLKTEDPNTLIPPMVLAITYPYITFFFRQPKQLEWIVEKIRERALDLQDSPDTIQVLSVGSSIGCEPLSIIMAVLEDYDSNPSLWGNFDVRTRLKVVGTDVDLDALLYMRRGIYHTTNLPLDDEMVSIEHYGRSFRKDPALLLDKYFDCIPNLGLCGFKEEYQPMLEVRQLDILANNSDLNGKSYIVVYNNVAEYLRGGSVKRWAADHVSQLSQRYITYLVEVDDPYTRSSFEAQTTPIFSGKQLHFAEKRPEEGSKR